MFMRCPLVLFASCAFIASPAIASSSCPPPPKQISKDAKVGVNGAVGKLLKLSGVELGVSVQTSTMDLLTKLPEADKIYLQQMLFAAYCGLLEKSDLKPEEKAERVLAYNSSVRATLAKAFSLSDKTVAAKDFYFGGQKQLLRVNSISLSCVSGQCVLRFIAATCKKEYLPGRDWGPVVSVALVDEAGQEISPTFGTARAWVASRYDYRPIEYQFPANWASAEVWNKASAVVLKSGWQRRDQARCS